MHSLLAAFWSHWQDRRRETYALIEEIRDEQLQYSPAARFGSLGRQLRHVADVQEVYQIALVEGSIDFRRKRKDPEDERSVKRLKDRFKKLDGSLHDWLSSFKGDPVAMTIRWGKDQLPLVDHLAGLLEHEAWHQGAWAVYQSISAFGPFSRPRDTSKKG